jgi:hypothetical protein
MDRSIPVHLWVSALIRRAHLGGAFATVVRRGDDDRGDVLVKVALPQRRASLYAPAFAPEGPPSFEALTEMGGEDEAEVDAMIERRRRYDSDLWVIEIEDRDGRHFLVEQVTPKAAGQGV